MPQETKKKGSLKTRQGDCIFLVFNYTGNKAASKSPSADWDPMALAGVQ